MIGMNISTLIDPEFSGVVSVAVDGRSVFRGEYGFADKANRVPNRIDTRFGTASAGKVFVATAILGLIEKGDLRFDSTIGEILKFDLKAIDPGITVRQLLNHTSGIPDYFDESVMTDYEELWVDLPNYRIRKSSDLIPLFIEKPMMYGKGTRFQYNNTGYVVLGLIIEELTGKPFDVYLNEAIFDPSGMTDTGYYELDRLPARCAFSYIFDEERQEFRTNIFSIDAKGSGAGGAFTTAPDVEKFWAALICGSLICGSSICGSSICGSSIRSDLVGEMCRPQVDEGIYGYGLWLLDGGVPSFQGCDPGANFITSYDRSNRRSITILSNIDFDVEELHEKIRATTEIR